MKAGDKVSWKTVNGSTSGVLEEDWGNGNWVVTLDNGASVIVNEASFIYE